MMLGNKQIKFGAILSYISIALNTAVGLIYTPWMIRQIGDSQYGLYTLANSLITLFLVDFGMSAATARYVSKYHAEENEEKVNDFLGVVYKLYLVIDAVILCILTIIFFSIGSIYGKLTPDELRQFKVVYLIAGGFSLINFPFVTLNGILTAYEQFVPQKLADVIYRVLIVVLMVVALLSGYGLYALVTVNAIVGLIVIVYKIVIIKKRIFIKVNWKYNDLSLFKEIFEFSVWTTVSILAQRLVFNITPSILGMLANSTAIAIFGVVSTIEGYTYTITTALNGMFMPKISKYYMGEYAESNISQLMITVGKFQYALNGLIVVGFAIVGNMFIHLWVRETYAEAYQGVLLVIIPGLLYNSLQIADTAIIVANKIKYSAIVNVIMGFINVILTLVFIPRFGVIGACMAIFVSYLTRSIALNVIYKKVLNLDIKSFIQKCYIRMSIPIVLTLLFGKLLNILAPLSSWFNLMLKTAVITAVYCVFVFFTGFTRNERNRLTSKFLRRKEK